MGTSMDLDPPTKRTALLALATSFLTMAAHALMETARDGLFLSTLPASRLPWIQLVVVAVGIALGLSSSRAPAVPRFPASMALAVSAAGGFTFFALARLGSTPVLYALSVWVGVSGPFVALRLWTSFGRAFAIHQAKRIFGLLGAGAAAGAIAGSWLARLAATSRDAPFLLLAAGAIFLGASVVGISFERRIAQPAASEAPERTSLGLALAGTPYVRLLIGLAAVSTVALSIADYLWKSNAAREVPHGELTLYLANANLAFGAASFLLQIVAARWLFETLGVRRAVFLVPSALLAAACIALYGGGGLARATLPKSVDGALRYSVHKTSMELLAVPLSDAIRERAKPLVELVGQRGGQALGSLVVLASLALGASDRGLTLLLVGLSAVWIALSLGLFRSYVDVFRQGLGARIHRSVDDPPILDAAALETLVVSLGGRRDLETLAAIRMLRDLGKAKLVSPLVLFHPSDAVREEALELFASERRRDALPTLDRLVAEKGRSAAPALRTRMRIAPVSTSAIRQYLASDDGAVRAVTAISVLSTSPRDGDASTVVRDLVRDGEPRALLEMVRALPVSTDTRAHAGFSDLLVALSNHDSVEVKLEVVRAMRRAPSRSYLPCLLEMLGDRALRTEATTTLGALGDPAFEALELRLSDDLAPMNLRLPVPRALAIAFGTRSVQVLERRLRTDSDGELGTRELRALEAVVREHPNTQLDRTELEATILDTLRALFTHATLRDALERFGGNRRTPLVEIVSDLLEDEVTHARTRVFRLLGLLYPREDMKRVYRGLFETTGRDAARMFGGAREILEHVVESPLRDSVLSVADAGTGSSSFAKLAELGEERFDSYESALARCTQRTPQDDTLATLVELHVLELDGRREYEERSTTQHGEPYG